MSLWIVLFITITLGHEKITGEHDAELLVTLPEGLAKGTLAFSDKGNAFYGFTGIPYAKPPLGKRRFQRPEQLHTWGEARGGKVTECTQEYKGREKIFRYTQWRFSRVKGVEDCLVLNIYIPNVVQEEDHSYPVMVFIHGGAYVVGSGSPAIYGPAYFMDHGVILITVNYRLGPLGFLSLGDSLVPGNLGLWDLAMATSFIHKRVALFGGDPQKITLFGHSAGAMSIQLLMMSQHVSGLFSAAILQSGPVLSVYNHSDKNPSYYGRTFAGAVGCNPKANTSTILECLQKTDLETIVGSTRLFDHLDGVLLNDPNPWQPIYDGSFLPSQVAFLNDDPWHLLAGGKFVDIPVIIGQTRDEGLYGVTEILSRRPDAFDVLFNNWGNHYGPLCLFNREEDEIDDTDREIAEEFLTLFVEGGKSRDPMILQNIFTPSVITVPNIWTSLLLTLGKTSPTYAYYYVHPGSLSLSDLLSYPVWKIFIKILGTFVNVDLFRNSLSGVTHFDEIFLLFQLCDIPVLQRHTLADQMVSDNLLTLWTNFAKTHNPVIDDMGNNIIVDTVDCQGDNLIWESFHKENLKYLEIGFNKLTMKHFNTFTNVVHYWINVFRKVSPEMHLWRSLTWKNSSMYKEINRKDLVNDILNIISPPTVRDVLNITGPQSVEYILIIMSPQIVKDILHITSPQTVEEILNIMEPQYIKDILNITGPQKVKNIFNITDPQMAKEILNNKDSQIAKDILNITDPQLKI